MIIAEGINDAWLQVLTQLNFTGIDSSPRGKKCKELLNVSVKINNPKKRILSLPIRKISLPYAFGELAWYLSGSNELNVMTYYSSNMKHFSDDGITLNSAYGYRIFGHHPDIPFNQWTDARDRLITDSETRQAIIHLHTPNNVPTKDEVCTLTLQFLVRNAKLDMVVNMRSNDIILGFTYDVFSFTTLQELMANELGIEVGAYYHNVASMHIYEKDYSYFDYFEAPGMFYTSMYMTKYDTEFSYDGMVIGGIDFDVLLHNERAARIEGKLINSNNKAVAIISDILLLYRIYRYAGVSNVVAELQHDNIYHCMFRAYVYRYTTLHDSNLVIVEGCEAAGKTTYTRDNGAGFDIIHFNKPKDFNKLLYFQYSLMTGDIMLDRFFYSEIVYSSFYNRECTLDEFDVKALEFILNYRGAKLKMLSTSSKECFSRLDENDAAVFNVFDIEIINNMYKVIFSESLLANKEMV